ncbi:MAG: prepilin peptidase [Thermoproteus sp.]|nr:prepilin peptidase [Thermoproteus sp.]
MIALSLAELALLAIAAYQDIKTREIDMYLIILIFIPSLFSFYLYYKIPLYFLSPLLGAILALVMRLTGSGYADSLVLLAISFFPPPVPFMPTPAVVVAGSSAPALATTLWLALRNRGMPCELSLLQRLTHVCASREEVLKHPHRYIIGDVKDLEHYTPPEVKEEYVVARYGVPYVAYLAVGFSLYVLLSFL